jgi:hypothetical protein
MLVSRFVDKTFAYVKRAAHHTEVSFTAWQRRLEIASFKDLKRISAILCSRSDILRILNEMGALSASVVPCLCFGL